ncbi:hypothetical protein [Sulfobacillus thermosulfidooxidans]|uniref:hypothetical protein n=1 Tax=Sulfobacillus thermosulfidooxidans TaxID=28034 RepID=UPI0006B53D9F|nr:hypothetical protein [Sulfobacillus thermosulfidooxidans]
MWGYATSLFWHIRWQFWERTVFLTGAGLADLTGHLIIGAGLILVTMTHSLFFLVQPLRCARRYQTRAIWWTASPSAWIRRQLPEPVSLGSTVWEVHAQDARRWAGPTPKDAARRYRQTYAEELVQLIQTRPDTVGLVSSGFNRLTDAERQAIIHAGGTIWDGPLWPQLLRRYPPWIMRATQRRMFGAVVSPKDPRTPATWVTWAIPARSE